MKNKITLPAIAIYVSLFSGIQLCNAQCIDCGTGTDGVFTAANNVTLAGGTYNYTSFTINAGVTVTVTGNSQLVIYSTGGVNILGTLNANGGTGGNGVTFSTFGLGGVGVAGGANGGDGVYIGSPNPGVAGFGTGAGGGGGGWSGGGGAGYAVNGNSSGGAGGFGGVAYGNVQITPIVAGSGGGGGSGGNSCGSGGGGAGGGVIYIATCGTLNIGAAGAILANGGNGGTDGGGNCGGGGGGSGGSVWLVAGTLNNTGTISAVGGIGGTTTIFGPPYYGNGGAGAVGRVRLDFVSNTGSGLVNPAAGYSITPSTLAAATSSTNAQCNGNCDGTIMTNVLNGTPPYTYLWSTGCTTASCNAICAGNYTVTVTDANGCSVIVNTSVSEPPVLSASIAPVSSICANVCTTLNASAVGGNGAPYFYTWIPTGPAIANPLVCPNVTTTYTCVITDSLGCFGSATTTVTVDTLPTLTLAAQSDTVCITHNINILFGTPSGGTYFGTGVGGNNFNGIIAGMGAHNVNYTYTGSNGCTDTITISIFVDACTGIDEADENGFVSIYPNPVNDQFSVLNSQFSIERIEVFDVFGKKLSSNQSQTSSFKPQTFTFNVTDFIPGIYFVKVKTSTGTVTKKIVKQ